MLVYMEAESTSQKQPRRCHVKVRTCGVAKAGVICGSTMYVYVCIVIFLKLTLFNQKKSKTRTHTHTHTHTQNPWTLHEH